MKQKDTDIAGFAIYAKNVSQYKKNTMMYQQRIEYIKSLFEVRRAMQHKLKMLCLAAQRLEDLCIIYRKKY